MPFEPPDKLALCNILSTPVLLLGKAVVDVVNVPTADCMLLLLLFQFDPLDIGIFLDLVGSFDPCYDHGHSFWVRFLFGPTWGGPFLSHWSVNRCRREGLPPRVWRLSLMTLMPAIPL